MKPMAEVNSSRRTAEEKRIEAILGQMAEEGELIAIPHLDPRSRSWRNLYYVPDVPGGHLDKASDRDL